MKECYKKMAEEIREAGHYIAAESRDKVYVVYNCLHGRIEVESDSGFECIIIGDVTKHDRYMYLFYKNTPKRDSFPCKTKIAKLLEAVANMEVLEEGEGMAGYFCENRKYLANLVKAIAGDY